MATYQGDSSIFHDRIYIFDPSDFVIGGEDGTSNVPVKNLADNSAYLKKFKGYLLRGNGAPTSAVLNGLDITDSNIISNTIYLDLDTGNFYVPNDFGDLDSWTNTYAAATLNVKGLKINNGNLADFISLTYNDTDPANKQLELRDTSGNLADLQIDTLQFNSLDGQAETQSKIIDNEILILYNVSSFAQNADGAFSAKRLENTNVTSVNSFIPAGSQTGYPNDTWNVSFSGTLSDILSAGDYVQITQFTELDGQIINGYYKVLTVDTNSFTTVASFNSIVASEHVTANGIGTLYKDNSAQIYWDEAEKTWFFKYRNKVLNQNDLTKVEAGGFLINDVPVGFYADRVIDNQVDFDALFKGDNSSDVKYLEIENQIIIIKPQINNQGLNYELYNPVEISGKNVRIETVSGAYIEFMTQFARFLTCDDNDMLIDSWNSNQINVLVENCYYDGVGKNGSDEIFPTVDDDVYIFSNTGNNNAKNIISSCTKKIRKTWTTFSDETVEILNELDTPLQTTNDTYCAVKFTLNLNDYITIFFNASVPTEIGYRTLIKSNERYIDHKKGKLSTTSGPFKYFSAKADSASQKIYYSAITSNDTKMIHEGQLSFSDLLTNGTINDSPESLDNRNITVSPAIAFTNAASKRFYISAKITSNILCITDKDAATTEFNSITISPNTNISAIEYNDELFIQYVEENSTNIMLLRLNTTSIDLQNTTLPTTIANGKSGKYSKIVEKDGILYFSYAVDNPLKTIGISTLDTTATGTVLTALSDLTLGANNFASYDFIIDTDNTSVMQLENNLMNIGDTDLFIISAIETTGTSSIKIFYTFDLVTWISNNIKSPSSTSTFWGAILAAYDNDSMTMIYNDTDNTWSLKIPFQNEITLQSNIRTNATISNDIISLNAVEGPDLRLLIDGGKSSHSNDTTNGQLSISNSFNGNFEINILNSSNSSSATGVINGNNKTFGHTIKLIHNDASSEFDNIFNEIKYCTIRDSIVLSGDIKTFQDCNNINFIGFVDGDAYIANGNFDE